MATELKLKVPRHIAIIMDGNGRWAEERGLRRYEGHTQGAKVVKEVVREAKKLGVEFLTLYAFSTENWQRPSLEINALMALLEHYLKNEIQDLLDENVQLRAIGNREAFPKTLQKLISEAEAKTTDNPELTLILALSYGAREEITAAVKAIAGQVKNDQITLESINEQLVAANLYTAKWPDPELLIRTSNEIRLSNFLLWQLSYAEFVFIPEYWPDFSGDKLRECLLEYTKRDRRYGKVKQN